MPMTCTEYGTESKEYEYLHDARFIEHYAMPKIKEIIGDNKNILDIGVRNAFWLNYFCSGNNNKGIGIDIGICGNPITSPGVKIWKKPLDVTNKLPFEDNRFDVSTLFAVLEHLYYPGHVYAVENMIRVTKEKVIIMTPNYIDHPRDPMRGRAIPEHINNFSCERFDRFLKSFGFRYEHIDIKEGYSSHIGVIYLE